jgi:hypothetical protein
MRRMTNLSVGVWSDVDDVLLRFRNGAPMLDLRLRYTDVTSCARLSQKGVDVSDERQRESLNDETRSAIEEVRTVLPGIQALFGFQLIAVFNERFQKIAQEARWIHLSSLLLVAIAIVCVMAPAAYHRIAERGWVSRRLINVTSNFLTAGMGLLALALTLEVALVVGLVLDSPLLGSAVGTALLFLVVTCWFVLPLRYRRRHRPRQ